MRKRRKRIFFYVKNRGNAVLAWVLLICVLLCAAALFVNARLSAVVRQYAEARVRYIATLAMNEAISEAMVSGEYQNLISFEKNGDGDIQALKTDMVRINQMKAGIVKGITQNLANINTSSISVPLGNLLGSQLFSGRGPRIAVRLVPVGSVQALIVSAFSSAGINQTKHEIIVEAVATVSVIMLGRSVTCEVKTNVGMTDVILVGKVPDSYTYIDDTRDGLVEKINDYK